MKEIPTLEREKNKKIDSLDRQQRSKILWAKRNGM